ncbi:hypothetical protein ACIOHB_21995 [Streptomyces microflavus]|uniref:hypothetical protein n=1 Tax=Streptomyces microflavus TaxID=1919 RepID=UPI0033F64A28
MTMRPKAREESLLRARVVLILPPIEASMLAVTPTPAMSPAISTLWPMVPVKE